MRRRAHFGLRQSDAVQDRREIADRRRRQREEHDRDERIDERNEVELYESELLELRPAPSFTQCACALAGHLNALREWPTRPAWNARRWSTRSSGNSRA